MRRQRPELPPSSDRSATIDIRWGEDGVGSILVGGEFWGAVEWSEKRQAWCIEDVEGKCLRHLTHVHGQADSRSEAADLALAMVRDGRMPSPQELREVRDKARERRAQQPAQIRKREERRQRDAAWRAAAGAQWTAESADKAELSLLEALAEAFDLTDPELWKSNSWAALRPRLIVHQRAVVARLESGLAWEIMRANTEPFAMYASKEARRQRRKSRQKWGSEQVREIEAKLDRAREILRALKDT